MPDPDRKTISATEAPALFNASPYCTRWMLYRKFATGLDISSPPNNRTEWGKRMQPLILQQVAADKGLEVIPNARDIYVRRGLIGCTRDAVIVCPERDPGALEVKCVFDYNAWGRNWQGGQTVPRHIEIQLQAQMLVGDGSQAYEWGLLAVWVCADVFYFERNPIYDLRNRLITEAKDFFDCVAAGCEPDPFGVAVEAPFITSLFATKQGVELDLSADPEHVKTSEDVSMYKTYKDSSASHATLAETLRVKLLALAKDAEYVRLPCGVSFRIKKSGKGKSIVPYVPDVPSAPPPSNKGSVLHAG